MRVLDIQLEADIGQLLLAAAMIDRMQAQNIQHSEIGSHRKFGNRRRCSTDTPKPEGVVGDDQTIFDLAQLCRTLRDQMRRRDNSGTFGAHSGSPSSAPKPPPPGVSMTNTSPGCITRRSVAVNSSTLPSTRSTQLRPTAAASPPAMP